VKSFLEKLHAAAEAQGRAEIAYRDESRRRLEELAALRTRAYRRYNLLNDMADLAQTQNEQEESVRLASTLTPAPERRPYAGSPGAPWWCQSTQVCRTSGLP